MTIYEAVSGPDAPKHIFNDDGICIRCGEDAEEWEAGCVEELRDAAAALRGELEQAKQWAMMQRETMKNLQNDLEVARLRRNEASEIIHNYATELATLTARLARVTNGLRTLLKSRDCLTLDGYAEIPEELSAQFDIGLDDARQIVDALAAPDGGQGVRATTGCGYCDDHDLRLKLVSGTGKFLGWYHDVDGVAQRCTAALAAPMDDLVPDDKGQNRGAGE